MSGAIMKKSSHGILSLYAKIYEKKLRKPSTSLNKTTG
jgi:hypothetical protein